MILNKHPWQNSVKVFCDGSRQKDASFCSYENILKNPDHETKEMIKFQGKPSNNVCFVCYAS